MSKDTPEVGDVWLNPGNFRVYVINFDVLVNTFFFYNNELWQGSFNLKEFLEQHTYLGKSKANINDLFKTENEE